MKRLNGKPTPMTRLIERAEFEKRLADFGTQMLKAFKRYEEHWEGRLTAQRIVIDELSARVPKVDA